MSTSPSRLISGTSYSALYAGRGPDGFLMLPDSHHTPARFRESCVGACIPRNVRVKFRLPVSTIRARLSTMLRTPMPETPVNVDRDLRRRKHDVGSSQDTACPDRSVDAVAQPSAVEFSSKSELRECVPSPIRPHRRLSGETGRGRIRQSLHAVNDSTPPACALGAIDQTTNRMTTPNSALGLFRTPATLPPEPSTVRRAAVGTPI
jgi:hypothetical protein